MLAHIWLAFMAVLMAQSSLWRSSGVAFFAWIGVSVTFQSVESAGSSGSLIDVPGAASMLNVFLQNVARTGWNSAPSAEAKGSAEVKGVGGADEPG